MKTNAHRPAFAILVGGGTAAALDIVYAFYRNGIANADPLRVLQSVASGWLGKDAFQQGWQSGCIGLLSHFGIVLVAAWIYFQASGHFASLRTRWLVFGSLYGVLVYLVMNFAVLPLSAAPFKLSYPPLRLLEGFVSHAILVGLPIAYAVKRWTRPVLEA